MMQTQRSINLDIYKSLEISEDSKVPILFLSNPGYGKTTTVEMFCKSHGFELKEIRGSEHSPEEILGFEVNNNGKLQKLLPQWFEEICSSDKKYMIFFDELTTVNEFVQAAMLNIIFNRTIDGIKLPDNCMIVSAGNYQNNLSDNFNLLYPTISRFCVVNIIPKASDLDDFMSSHSPVSKMEDEKKDQTYESIKDDIPEIIEETLRHVSQDLISQGIVNMELTDFRDCYTKSNMVSGFFNFRSLNYLRDILISSYKLYGNSDGVPNLMAYGLVGGGDNTAESIKEQIHKIYLKKIIKELNSVMDYSSRDAIIDPMTEGPEASQMRMIIEQLRGDRRVTAPIREESMIKEIETFIYNAQEAISSGHEEYNHSATWQLLSITLDAIMGSKYSTSPDINRSLETIRKTLKTQSIKYTDHEGFMDLYEKLRIS